MKKLFWEANSVGKSYFAPCVDHYFSQTFTQNPHILHCIPHRLGLEMVIERDGEYGSLGAQNKLPLDPLQQFLFGILMEHRRPKSAATLSFFGYSSRKLYVRHPAEEGSRLIRESSAEWIVVSCVALRRGA